MTGTAAGPPPDGYVARWRGVEYEASPDGEHVRLYATEPAEGFVGVGPGRYRAIVPQSSVEGFGYLRTVCHWHGEPFLVLAEDAGWLRVEYLGDTAGFPTRLRLEEFHDGVHQGWAPRHELADFRQERR